MDGLAIVILAIHLMLFFIGFIVKPLQSRPYVSGIIAVLVSAILFFIILDGGPGGSLGTHSAWYLICAAMTLGGLPIFTLGSSYWSGRFFSSLVRLKI